MLSIKEVMLGLESCIAKNPDDLHRCDECPYTEGFCTNRMKMDALATLKEQEEQKQKWLKDIEDKKYANKPTGFENFAVLYEKIGICKGLQMAYEIITGEKGDQDGEH